MASGSLASLSALTSAIAWWKESRSRVSASTRSRPEHLLPRRPAQRRPRPAAGRRRARRPPAGGCRASRDRPGGAPAPIAFSAIATVSSPVIGGRRPVDELVALVDDHRVVLGQHRDALERVDREHRVVRDHDVGLLRQQPALHREALLAEGAAALPHALAPTHREGAPHPRVDVVGVLVAIAGRRLLGPRPHRDRLLAECALRRVEQPLALVVRHGAVQLLQADVVVASLEDGERQGSADQRCDGLGHAGQVAIDELPLQREGRRRDDDRATSRRCGMQRRRARGSRRTCRCRCLPARSRARCRTATPPPSGPSAAGPRGPGRRWRRRRPRARPQSSGSGIDRGSELVRQRLGHARVQDACRPPRARR